MPDSEPVDDLEHEIVDLFAGPGGWDVGAILAGLPAPYGIEVDPDACATRRANGLPTCRADIATLRPLRCRGLIASPPCTAFSSAGKREGIDHLAALIAAVEAGDWGWRPPSEELRLDFGDEHAPDPAIWLPLEVGRWIEGGRPEWVACEQVPEVLPVWEAYARWLESLDVGWSTWTGILYAEQYGVAQTRRRAVLMASRVRQVTPPPATHQRYVKGVPRDPDGELAPWVSMAEALGWGATARPYPTIATSRGGGGGPDREKVGGAHAREAIYAEQESGEWIPGSIEMVNTTSTTGERYQRSADEPAPTIIGNARSARFLPPDTAVNTGRDWKPGEAREEAQTFQADERPAPAVTGKSGGQWQLNPARRPAGDDSGGWAWERPATTIAGDSRCWPPGHKINQSDIDRLGLEEATERYGDRAGTEAVNLTVHEAAALQSFPTDYVWAGTRTAQFQQIGNAVPCFLAAAILAALTGSRVLDIDSGGEVRSDHA